MRNDAIGHISMHYLERKKTRCCPYRRILSKHLQQVIWVSYQKLDKEKMNKSALDSERQEFVYFYVVF